MNLTLLLAELPGSTLIPTLPPAPPVAPALSVASEAVVPGAYLTFTLGCVTLFLGSTLLWLLIGLARNPAWSIADAISEEAGNQPATLPPGVKPIMVASSSRLIAVLGLLVIVAMTIGVGYGIIWSIFTHQQLQLQGLLSYFYGMAALFAPYAVNQLKEAFSAFAQTTQTPSPPQIQPPPQPQTQDHSLGSATVQQQAPSSPRTVLQPSVQLPVLKQPVQLESQK